MTIQPTGASSFERIEIFRLARQQAHHGAILEDAARIALAHELGEVAAEQHVEDRVRLGVVDRLRHRAGVDLAERRRLLGDELDVGLRLLHQRLEILRGRLAVFEVRIDQRPALLLRGDRRRHQHRGLHVGRGAQAEGVFVAVLPGDLVGQRLGGEEEHLLLAGEIGDRETDIARGTCRRSWRRLRASPVLRRRARLRPDWRRRRARSPRASCRARRPWR